MKKRFLMFLGICCIPVVPAFAGDVPVGQMGADERPRIIATTDGEIDDQCSLVRFLLYANEWDI